MSETPLDFNEFLGGGDMPLPASNMASKAESNQELDNFLRTVDDINHLVKGLASKDPKENERALRQADMLLHQTDLGNCDLDRIQCTVTQERSQINTITDADNDAYGEGDMSQAAFMRMVEKDAKERSENRKMRKQESDKFRKTGNILFGKKDYAGALYNYNEAIKLIKDSPCLYNNRALTYLRLGLYSSTIDDCDKALDLETYSFRARMYKAKALFLTGEAEKCRQELENAKELMPGHQDMIEQYEEEIFNMGSERPDDDFYSAQEKKWQDAANFKGAYVSGT